MCAGNGEGVKSWQGRGSTVLTREMEYCTDQEEGVLCWQRRSVLYLTRVKE